MKKFWTSKSYTIMALLMDIIVVFYIIFVSWAFYASVIQVGRKDQTLPLVIAFIVGCGGVALGIILTIGFTQFAYIDENGVGIKNLVGRKILYRKWSEIKYITNDRYPISWKAGFNLGYYTLIDERENLPEGNGLTTKKSYIKLPRNKKIEALVKQYYQGEIKENLVEDKK